MATPTTVKCIVVGDSASGKTSLLHRFTKNQFSNEHLHTIGVEFASKVTSVSSGERIKMCVWDTAGQEKYKSVTRSYYRGAAVCYIVFDITRADSFTHVTNWLGDVRQFAHSGAVVVLIGNKSDLSSSRQVDTSAARQLADQDGLLFFETSARSGENVEQAFLAGAEKALQTPNGLPTPVPQTRPVATAPSSNESGGCPC